MDEMRKVFGFRHFMNLHLYSLSGEVTLAEQNSVPLHCIIEAIADNLQPGYQLEHFL